MAGFRNIPHGKVEQLLSRLAEAGFDEPLIDYVNSRPELVREWQKSLREQLNPPAPTFTNLFRSPEQIFEAFVARASQWGFTKEERDQLRAGMPADFTSRLDSVLTLDIWLGDLPTTFEELWAWNKAVHGANGTWRWDGLKSGKKQLRLLDSKRYGTQPSVRWVVLDLTANWDKQNGIRPRDVRDPANSAGLQILSAAALHPDWPKAIDYDTIPGVWLPGLQASVPGIDPWSHVPILICYVFDRGVSLNAVWVDDRDSHYAVPVFREL